MFNRSILLLSVAFSLCVIYTSAAPKKIVSRQVRSSYENFFDVESRDQYQTIELEDENESSKNVLLDENSDESRLAREVAEDDYLPPPKHAYETGNGELSQKTIGTSQIDDAEKVEDSQYTSDEIREALIRKLEEEAQPEIEELDAQMKANKRYGSYDDGTQREAKELADLEAQIIPNSKAASDQSEDDEEGYLLQMYDVDSAE